MMGSVWRADEVIDTDQPLDRVFNYLVHWNTVEEWDTTVSRAYKLTPGPPDVGSRFAINLRWGWKRVPMIYTIRDLEPQRLIVLDGIGAGFRAVDRIRLEKRSLGTRLTYAVEVTFDYHRLTIADRIGQLLFHGYAHRAIRRLQAMLTGAPKGAPALTPLTRMADRAILPGLIGFTSLGYTLGKDRRPVASALYAGRTMVLTGGTSGIGRAAVRELVGRGAHVVVVGRDADKLDKLRMELNAVAADGSIETERADLSLLADVRDLAARLLRRHSSIDVLINNAGALFNRYQQTCEGIERTMATDLASPYLLTRLLLPALMASGHARVINVASGGMYTQGMRVDALTPLRSDYDGPTAYARAKRGLVILAQEWARQWAGTGTSVHAMHPGWVDTPGLERSLPRFHRLLAPWLRTPKQGADTIVWLAASPDAHRASGHFWLDRKIRETQVFRHTGATAADRRELIRTLDHLTGLSSAGWPLRNISSSNR
jgi:NAD(P)-dependent dehydrogenase (short-subunit alcohol dehydrogenase family)